VAHSLSLFPISRVYMLNYSILGLIFFTELSIVGSLAIMIDEQVMEAKLLSQFFMISLIVAKNRDNY